MNKLPDIVNALSRFMPEAMLTRKRLIVFAVTVLFLMNAELRMENVLPQPFLLFLLLQKTLHPLSTSVEPLPSA